MYFLNQTWAGMKRRAFATALMFFASVAISLSGATILLWSSWLNLGQSNARAERLASVFVESPDANVISVAIQKIRTMPGIEAARQIAVEDFLAYLRKNFPDIAEAMEGMAADAFPNMIEVLLPRNSSASERASTLDEILSVPGVARVDSGAKHIGPARDSLRWLSNGGFMLGIGLWIVLTIVAMGHFQAIRYKEAQEIQLLRSFGADTFWVYLPWFIEASLYAAVGASVAVAILAYCHNLVSATFNQFFDVMGYDSFSVNPKLLLTCGIGMFLAGLLAQLMGGLLAAVRGRFA